MRTIIFARGQVAVPLAAALECGLLIGGLEQADVDAMIERFKADERGVLIVTYAYQHIRIEGVYGVVIPTEDSFCSYGAMERIIAPPPFEPPTADDFIEWYRVRNPIKPAKRSKALAVR